MPTQRLTKRVYETNVPGRKKKTKTHKKMRSRKKGIRLKEIRKTAEALNLKRSKFRKKNTRYQPCVGTINPPYIYVVKF